MDEMTRERIALELSKERISLDAIKVRITMLRDDEHLLTPNQKRNLSIAITHLEDALYRVTEVRDNDRRGQVGLPVPLPSRRGAMRPSGVQPKLPPRPRPRTNGKVREHDFCCYYQHEFGQSCLLPDPFVLTVTYGPDTAPTSATEDAP